MFLTRHSAGHIGSYAFKSGNGVFSFFSSGGDRNHSKEEDSF